MTPTTNPQRCLNILVVDDDLDIAELMARRLKNDRNEVFVAHTGYADLETFKSMTIDVVLMDVVMPGMSGIEACPQMRQMPRGKEAIIMAQTAWDRKEDRLRVAEAGFDHFLVKPVDTKSLNELLEHVRVLYSCSTEE